MKEKLKIKDEIINNLILKKSLNQDIKITNKKNKISKEDVNIYEIDKIEKMCNIYG